jgi:hypothetical protein
MGQCGRKTGNLKVRRCLIRPKSEKRNLHHDFGLYPGSARLRPKSREQSCADRRSEAGSADDRAQSGCIVRTRLRDQKDRFRLLRRGLTATLCGIRHPPKTH